MPEVIEERSGHLLIQTDDGGVDLISLSPFNRLLYDHELFGLLRDQDESLELSSEDWNVTITPLGEQEYEVDIEDEMAVKLKPHEKTALVDILVEIFEDGEGEDPEPLVKGVMALRDYDVLPRVVDEVADVSSFDDTVEVQEDGWLIHDYLLLTYHNEFVNTRTDTHSRSGDSVRSVDGGSAYELRFQRQSTLGDSFDNSREARFIARAKWAVDKAAR